MDNPLIGFNLEKFVFCTYSILIFVFWFFVFYLLIAFAVMNAQLRQRLELLEPFGFAPTLILRFSYFPSFRYLSHSHFFFSFRLVLFLESSPPGMNISPEIFASFLKLL